MFCKNCGTKMGDNERFCPECGTPAPQSVLSAAVEPANQTTVETVAEVAETVAETAQVTETVLGAETVAETTPVVETVAETAPAAENVTEAADEAKTIAPTQAQLQSPKQPQLQTVQVSPQMAPQVAKQLENAAAGGGQTPYAQMTGNGHKEKVKREKVHGGKFTFGPKQIVLTAIGVVIIALIVLGIVFIPGFIRRTFSNPTDYAHYILEQSAQEGAKNAAGNYADALRYMNIYDGNYSVESTVSIGADLETIIESGLHEEMPIPSEFTTVTTYNAKDGLASLSGKLSFGRNQAFSYQTIANPKKERLYVQIPELSDAYMQFEYDEIDEILGIGRYSPIYQYYDLLDAYYEDYVDGPVAYYGASASISDFLEEVMGEDAMDALSSVLAACPDQAMVEKLYLRYAGILIAHVKDVQKGKENLTIDGTGVAQGCTTLTFTLDEYEMQDMIEDFIDAMLDDEDIKNVLSDIADAVDEDDSEVYRDFKKALREAKKDASDIPEYNHFTYEITLWVDSFDGIRGWRAHLDDEMEIGFAMPKSGSNVAYEYYMDSPHASFDLIGKGTESFGKTSGELTYYIDGVPYLLISLKDVNLDACKKGNPNGTVTLRPSAEMADHMAEQLYYVLGAGIDVEDFRLIVSMNGSKDNAECNVQLMNGDRSYLQVKAKAKYSAGIKIEAPSNRETISIRDVYDFEDYLEEADYDKWLKQLDSYGVEGYVIDDLEQLFDSLMDL